MQWKQIKEQFELLNLTRVKTAGNWKLLRKKDREFLQLNASFATLSREMMVPMCEKNSV